MPKVLHRIGVRWQWRPFKYREFIVMFKKLVIDDLGFVTLHVILLETAIGRWVQCGHKDINMVSNNIQADCGF